MSSPALPFDGEVFVDVRGEERALRVSWHRHIGPHGIVVLSLWRAALCVGTFRLNGSEVRTLVDVLTAARQPTNHPDEPYDVEQEGIADAPVPPRSTPKEVSVRSGAAGTDQPVAPHPSAAAPEATGMVRTRVRPAPEIGPSGTSNRTGTDPAPENYHPGYSWPPPPGTPVPPRPASQPRSTTAPHVPWPPSSGDFDDPPEDGHPDGGAETGITITGDVATDRISKGDAGDRPGLDHRGPHHRRPSGSWTGVYHRESSGAPSDDSGRTPDGAGRSSSAPASAGSDDETIDVGLDIFWSKAVGDEPRNA